MKTKEVSRETSRFSLRSAIKTTLDAAHSAWLLAERGNGLSQWETVNITRAIDAASEALKLAQAIEEKGQAE